MVETIGINKHEVVKKIFLRLFVATAASMEAFPMQPLTLTMQQEFSSSSSHDYPPFLSIDFDVMCLRILTCLATGTSPTQIQDPPQFNPPHSQCTYTASVHAELIGFSILYPLSNI